MAGMFGCCGCSPWFRLQAGRAEGRCSDFSLSVIHNSIHKGVWELKFSVQHIAAFRDSDSDTESSPINILPLSAIALGIEFQHDF
jgi:hypothetical protein